MRARPRILVLAGSNRAGSLNMRLAGAATRQMAGLECDITRITLRDYPLPLFDMDLEVRDGVPENALRLARLFHRSDGILLASPEYNASISPLTKNVLDWISRVRNDGGAALSPYRGRVFAILSASPGRLGGMRGLIALRASLIACGALVLSEQLAVAAADQAFDDSEALREEADRRQLDRLCRALVETAALLATR